MARVPVWDDVPRDEAGKFVARAAAAAPVVVAAAPPVALAVGAGLLAVGLCAAGGYAVYKILWDD